MAKFGYTLSCEQSPPDALVRDARRAEEVGFDFSVISDHFQPWVEAQGHSPYCWSVLGAVAAVTEQLPLMTFVTCPTVRYHPAIVAQKAATVQILSEGRFRLGLGAGEKLNEHVVGNGWPSIGTRHQLLSEAIEIIAELFDAGDEMVNFHGKHFNVEGARIWDQPEQRVPIGLAVSGPESCAMAGKKADLMIAVEPDPELGEKFDAAGGSGKDRVGQIAVSYDTDRDAAKERAREQFGWFGLGWGVNDELPNPTAFENAMSSVTADEVAEQIPCGSDVGEFVEKIKPFVDAGFTDIALLQIGADQQESFAPWAESELLPALREL